ncbi:O-methylsterigmatocystin oxidoreductase [Leucoagaricus sp. SymC.cos]|nr:O-methylsterigmatocystin oxidoreductase [Leucoagaricus sp. SymC.cos]
MLQANDLVILVIALVLHYYYRNRRYPKLPLPPGPPRLPIIGNALEIPQNYAYEYYAKMSQKYNTDILYLEAFGQSIIVLNDLKTTEDLLNKRSANYSSRPHLTMLHELVSLNSMFALLPYGEPWRAQRKLFQRHFSPRDMAANKESAAYFIQRSLLPNLLDSPVQYREHLHNYIGCLAISMTYGLPVRATGDKWLKSVDEAFLIAGGAAVAGKFLVDIFPWLKYVPDWMPGAQFKRDAKRWKVTVQKSVIEPFEAAKQAILDGTAKRSFISAALDECDENADDYEYQIDNIQKVASNIYAAAADTVANSILTFILAMFKFPEVQRRAQQEVDDVIGPDRLPETSDILQLPFTSAVFKEALRWHAVTPAGIPHCAVDEDVYNGYYIPKGSVVIGNSYAMLRDERVYPKPDEFLPERFLRDGKLSFEVPDPEVYYTFGFGRSAMLRDERVYPKPDEFLPERFLRDGKLSFEVPDPEVYYTFGFGRRICPGSHVGLLNYHLTALCLLSLFDISPEIDKNGGIIDVPLKFMGSTVVSGPEAFPYFISFGSPWSEIPTAGCVNVASLKKVKNSVIGNPSAKKQLAQDGLLIQTLIACLNPPHIHPTYPEPHESTSWAQEDSIRIEAAHVIASLASSEEALSTLLDHEAPHAFLVAISYLQPSDPISLRSAIIRGLRSLIIAMADLSGPSQWGLMTHKSKVRNQTKDGLNYLFQIESLDIYLPLLIDSSSQISTSIAQIVACAVRTPEHRKALSEWLPHEDRLREAKVSRRGWEKTSVVNVNAPSRGGGWLARHLTAFLSTRDSKLREAALLALAALAKDNSTVATVLARPDRDYPPTLSAITPFVKSRNVDTQIAAALCATHIIRGSITNNAYPIDESGVRAVINFVNSMIISPSTESASRRTKTCFILYYMITDDSTLCNAAFDRGCLEKLAAIVRESAPEDNKVEWGEDEAESTSLLRESALTAIAAMSLFDSDIRRTVTDDLSFVPYIHSCLFHQHVGVRYAAAQCVRTLSRAVTVLRTNIVDSGLGMTIFSIFKNRDEDANVVNAALSSVCNIVIDFSPLRPIYLEQGLMDRLLELLRTGDSALKLNSLWAVKNLLRNSTTETKRSVMRQLSWDRVVDYLRDGPIDVQEQTFSILRNVAESQDGTDLIFKNIPTEILLGHITSGLTSPSDDVMLQATHVLANMINGSEAHRNQIAAYPNLLANLRTCLAEGKAEVKKPATSCIHQLARNSKGRRAIIEAGIISTLRHLCEWSGSGMSSATISSPISVGSPGVSIAAGGRGLGPGGRNWGPTVGMNIGASHGHSQSQSHLGSGYWSGSSHVLPHYPHYPHSVFHSHHALSGVYQPHSAAHQHGTAMEDDKEVVHIARAALDWLERGDSYS